MASPVVARQHVADDAPFRHRSLKSDAIAFISQSLFSGITYTQHHGLIAGMKRRGGLGWLPLNTEPTDEERFWMRADLNGKVVYDIGSFHGLMAMFFAKAGARQVYAWEPFPRNAKVAEANARINKLPISVRRCGLGDRIAAVRMSADSLRPGMAHVSENGDLVEFRTLDSETAMMPPEVIKIDVEGYEIHVLRGGEQTIMRHRPEIVLELHGDSVREKIEKSVEILDWLTARGYSVRHIESGDVSPDPNVRYQGHLHATAR